MIPKLDFEPWDPKYWYHATLNHLLLASFFGKLNCMATYAITCAVYIWYQLGSIFTSYQMMHGSKKNMLLLSGTDSK